MKSNNVLFFPTERTTHITLERVQEIAEQNKREATEIIIDSIVPEILSKLNDYSVTLSSEHDIGLICEVLRSTIYRTQNIEHPLQQVSEKMIRIID